MQNLWNETEARACVERGAEQGIAEDLALRVYTTRLLGGDPRLVLHGGGNTSVKTEMEDLIGDRVPVLCVKGSGWDMASIEAPGLPAVRLAPLQRLRARQSLSDEDMVNLQRTNLLDANSPNPSVETLLHAFLPHKFVDHTHSTAVLALTDQPDGEALCREVFGDRVGYVPYIMAGFGLAKHAVQVYEADPAVEGLILLKHGIFSFGETAEQAYGRMIDLVSLAEARLARGRRPVFASAAIPDNLASVATVAPLLRGALALKSDDGAHRRWLLAHRQGEAVMAYVNGAEVGRYANAGVVTADHVIRTKGWPLILPAPQAGELDAFRTGLAQRLDDFAARYHDYFERNNARLEQPKTELDRVPRVVLVPGLGLFGVGKSDKDAAIAADIAECAIEGITLAEGFGRFESISEADLFEIEYWSLEQAKLGKGGERPLERQVAVVTGGAGTIGAATARLFAANGAAVAVLDLDGDRAAALAGKFGGLGLGCDVTDRVAVAGAFERVVERFGGIDIVVSNAGAAWPHGMAEMPDDLLRRSFELNFFAHQSVAQCAVRVMRAQDTGGALLFNVSKQAVNPGRDFGAYGLPKAALLSLVRQYALEHGADGIRANAVNADRIRGGLLTDEMVSARAKSRGLSEEAYLRGNLLGREVKAEDVARAFLDHALALKTTADVTTVDGGNIEASLR